VPIVGLLCLGLVLACSGCSGGSAWTGGCQMGGLTATADPCNAGNQGVGAFSRVPFGGGLSDR
jgi:hypothetical protein